MVLVSQYSRNFLLLLPGKVILIISMILGCVLCSKENLNSKTILIFWLQYVHYTVESYRQQVLVNIMFQRPRFNFSDGYFVQSFQLECRLLEEKYKLVKCILDDHIQEQRHYKQSINRNDTHCYGVPFKIIPVQPISVNTSRPALKDIFLLEFHTTIASISKVPNALLKAHRQLLHMFQPESVTGSVKLEISLVAESLKEWSRNKSFGCDYSHQSRKDLFSDVFIEDPMFVSEVGESLSVSKDSKGIIRTV